MFNDRFITTFSVTTTPRKNAYKPSLYDICLEYGIKDVIPWLTRFLLFQQGRLITYFPHYPCIRFCLLNFPGKFSWKQKISLSSNFPLHAWWGKFRRKQRISLSSNFPLHAWWGKFRRQKRTSLPLIGELYLIENHRHNYVQYLTTPSRTHSNNHFASFYSLILNISIVGENSVYAHA